MQFHNLGDFKGGWIIGDFNPSILRTPSFEVCVTFHGKEEPTVKHFHAKSKEYNIVLDGEIAVNGRNLGKGDIFIYEENEVSDVHFLSDTSLLVVRVPSLPEDKYIV